MGQSGGGHVVSRAPVQDAILGRVGWRPIGNNLPDGSRGGDRARTPTAAELVEVAPRLACVVGSPGPAVTMGHLGGACIADGLRTGSSLRFAPIQGSRPEYASFTYVISRVEFKPGGFVFRGGVCYAGSTYCRVRPDQSH